jgi:hypothetical protein
VAATLQGYALIQGDLEPDMLIDLAAPAAIAELPTALGVVLQWLKPDGTLTSVPLVIVTASGTVGQVKRVWQTGDSALVGLHKGVVQVTCANGEICSDPNDGTPLVWNVFPLLPTP